MLLPQPIESPRFGFALCLPMLIDYIVDFRMDSLILVELSPPIRREFPRLGFALCMFFVRPCELVILLNL
jgi:hypothetical protein